MPSSPAIDWDNVDTIMLDMDGTLLDLGFDNWFWLTLVPSRYAAANQLTEAAARERLQPMFDRVAHTLPWYCIEHWTRELALDICGLKREAEAQARVRFLPGAQAFLERVKMRGKRLLLVTNSHPTTLAIKDERVAVTPYFDQVYSTHAFGVPKENPQFWPKLALCEPFQASRTLFVDDSLPVLDAAHAFGIAQLRAVRRPDTNRPPQSTGSHIGIDAVADLT